MANTKNLKNLAERPPEEAREIRSKGAKKANEVKRRKKAFMEYGQMVLSLRPKAQKALRKEWAALGYDVKAAGLPTVAERIAMQLAQRALDGDDEALRLCMSYAHYPTMKEQIEIDRVKALAERENRVDVTVNAEEPGALEAFRARMAEEIEKSARAAEGDAP